MSAKLSLRTDGQDSGRQRLQTVRRACSLLKAFADEDERLTLSEISARTKIEKTIAFRLVHTLEDEGLLRKVDVRRYCLNIRLLSRKKFRLGYAAQSPDSPFSSTVSEGLNAAAAKYQVDLISFDNHYSPSTAVRVAHRMIAERVDVAIEFQTFAKIAPIISSLFQNAGIPLIAVEIPHPGAVFYGVDNYNVGRLAGQVLARWAKKNWQGRVDELLLLGLEAAGPLPQLRLVGAETAAREGLAAISRVCGLDTRGEFVRSLELVRKHLRVRPPQRTLIAGVNDPAVLGALHAFEEAGRAELCVGVGLGAIPEARAELRRPGSRLIGTVAFFPEQYGEDIVKLAIDILHQKHVPPAVYTHYQLVTPELVDRIYPLDTKETGLAYEIR
jgi:ribose transport system substrate-binding protein